MDTDELDRDEGDLRRVFRQGYCVELQLRVLKFLLENPTDSPKGHAFAAKLKKEVSKTRALFVVAALREGNMVCSPLGSWPLEVDPYG